MRPAPTTSPTLAGASSRVANHRHGVHPHRTASWDDCGSDHAHAERKERRHEHGRIVRRHSIEQRADATREKQRYQTSNAYDAARRSDARSAARDMIELVRSQPSSQASRTAGVNAEPSAAASTSRSAAPAGP